MKAKVIRAERLTIYVACLASYVAGRLHGVHLKLANMDWETVQEKIAEMLRTSPTPLAEEVAIHDDEWFPFRVGEYANIKSLWEFAQGVGSLPEEEQEHLCLWMKAFDIEWTGDWDKLYHDFNQAFPSLWEERDGWAENYFSTFHPGLDDEVWDAIDFGSFTDRRIASGRLQLIYLEDENSWLSVERYV